MSRLHAALSVNIERVGLAQRRFLITEAVRELVAGKDVDALVDGIEFAIARSPTEDEDEMKYRNYALYAANQEMTRVLRFFLDHHMIERCKEHELKKLASIHGWCRRTAPALCELQDRLKTVLGEQK